MLIYAAITSPHVHIKPTISANQPPAPGGPRSLPDYRTQPTVTNPRSDATHGHDLGTIPIVHAFRFTPDYDHGSLRMFGFLWVFGKGGGCVLGLIDTLS